MTYEVRLEKSALRDIEGIVERLKIHAPEKVGEWVDFLFADIQTLEAMPNRCSLAPENGRWGKEEIRQLLFTKYPSKYRILFTVQGNEVRVLQIRHGSRRYLFEDE